MIRKIKNIAHAVPVYGQFVKTVGGTVSITRQVTSTWVLCKYITRTSNEKRITCSRCSLFFKANLKVCPMCKVNVKQTHLSCTKKFWLNCYDSTVYTWAAWIKVSKQPWTRKIFLRNINIWLLKGIDFYCKQYLTECMFLVYTCICCRTQSHHCYDRINEWIVL